MKTLAFFLSIFFRAKEGNNNFSLSKCRISDASLKSLYLNVTFREEASSPLEIVMPHFFVCGSNFKFLINLQIKIILSSSRNDE